MNAPVSGGRRELVWRNGVNETDLGPMLWNDRARKVTMGVYGRRGNPVLLDVNHNYNEEKRAGWEARGEAAPTAGNGRLELDAQGNLWMVPEWSDYARARIDGRQLRFLSPDFDFDKKTGEILEVYRISLVAEPGTWRARMVANAQRRKGRLTMVSPELIAAITEMATLMAAEQVSDALKESINKVVAMAGGDAPEVMDPAADLAEVDLMDPKPDAVVSRNLTLARTYAVQTATLAARRVISEKRLGAREELALTAAEEEALAPISDPAEFDRAIGILRANRKGAAAKGKLGREAAREETKVEPRKPTGNAYLDAMAKHGLEVAP